jgi:hypothetical protein
VFLAVRTETPVCAANTGIYADFCLVGGTPWHASAAFREILLISCRPSSGLRARGPRPLSNPPQDGHRARLFEPGCRVNLQALSSGWGSQCAARRLITSRIVFRVLRAPVLNQVLLHITPRSDRCPDLGQSGRSQELSHRCDSRSIWEFLRMAGTRQATLARNGLPRSTYIKDNIGDIKAPTLIL